MHGLWSFRDFVPKHANPHHKVWIYQDPESGEILDECMLTRMDAPNTYTKEDVIEINCHGSYAVLRRVLELVFRMGARSAEPGEFTKRAFLNGRIDLSGSGSCHGPNKFSYRRG